MYSAQIQNIVNTIQSNFEVRKIYLFGSYAEGNFNKDSDVDLCIIADFKGKRKIEMLTEMRTALINLKVPLDLLVYEEDEFDERAALKTSFEHLIKTKGKVLNGE